MRKTLITVGALITASILTLWVGFSAASSAAVQSPAGTAVTGTQFHPAQAAPTPEPAESAEPKGDTSEGATEQGETGEQADSTEPAESAEPKGDTSEGATEQGETADGTNQKGEAGEQEDSTAQDATPEGSAG
jgi:hypothetical protein